jgi:hypothetical protein
MGGRIEVKIELFELGESQFALCMIAESPTDERTLQKIRKGTEGIKRSDQKVFVKGIGYGFHTGTYMTRRVGLWGQVTESMQVTFYRRKDIIPRDFNSLS